MWEALVVVLQVDWTISTKKHLVSCTSLRNAVTECVGSTLLIMNVQTEGMWLQENANSSLYLARRWQSDRDFPFLTILSKLP